MRSQGSQGAVPVDRDITTVAAIITRLNYAALSYVTTASAATSCKRVSTPQQTFSGRYAES